MGEANSRDGGWAHRPGVVDRKAAPNRAGYQHIIGPPPSDQTEVIEHLALWQLPFANLNRFVPF